MFHTVMRSDALVDVYHDGASASKLAGASRTEVWDSRAHHPRPLICHSLPDKNWGHSHPPSIPHCLPSATILCPYLGSTLSILCLAVRQFPSGYYACWASFDTACLDK